MTTAYSDPSAPAGLPPSPTPTGPAGTSNAPHDQAPEGERELVAKLTTEFELDEKREREAGKDFEKFRQYQRGQTPGGKFTVNVNLCQSTKQVLVSRLYARNPDVTVKPSDAVNPTRFEEVRSFGRTLEVVISSEWRRRKLKRRIKRQVRSTLTIGFAWLKAAMQIDQVTDPVVQSRINDLQDNLREIDRKIQELRSQDYPCANEELTREEILLESQAAQSRLEVEQARGLVFANPRAEDVIVSGEIRELEDYLDAEHITHRTWWKATAVAATFGLTDQQLATAKRYKLQGDSSAPSSVQEQANGDWLAVLERWDKKAGLVHLWVHGLNFLLRPSAAPNPAASRFYPFFLMAWNWLDDTRLPQSDTEQWAPLQDEYNSVRSNYREHRRRSLPARVANGAIVQPGDAAKLKAPEINELVVLEGVDPQIPVGNLVTALQGAAIDPALYDTNKIMYDLDVVSGVQEAARQAISRDKTATEAEIQESAAQGRTGARTEEIEDVLEDLAIYSAELLLQTYTELDAIRIAGEGAVWPELSIDELHQLVMVEIRAGTTGKPDTSKRQQVWGTLLPVIQPMLERIHMLRRAALGGMTVDQATGMPMQQPPDPWAAALADCLEELLKETLTRADDRIDVDRFLPKMGQVNPQAAGMTAGMPGGAPGATPPPPGPGGPPALPAPAGNPPPAPAGIQTPDEVHA